MENAGFMNFLLALFEVQSSEDKSDYPNWLSEKIIRDLFQDLSFFFFKVCEMLRNGATYIWDDEMKVPYCVHGDQWVGFDDEKSIRNKMR